jgi:hypothetical protein
MKSNPFNTESPIYPFRWFILVFLILAGWMSYNDWKGERTFGSTNQQNWSSSGPGYHK